MRFAKLVEGSVLFCPKSGTDAQNRFHTNLQKHYEFASDRDGWLEVVETEKPQGDYISKYTKQDNKIIQSWVPYTPPMSEPNAFQMRADIDYIAMMTDVDMEVIM